MCEPRWGSWLGGVMQTVGVIGVFVLLGLGARAVAPGESAATPYTPAAMSQRDESTAVLPSRAVWLVDGFNVLHADLPNGEERGEWWRAEARERLIERAASFEDPGAEIWVVFDGPRPAPEGETSHPRVLFAPSADAWLLERVRAARDPDQLVLVTRDRRLADRAERRGARVVGPAEFLRRCPGV